MINVANLLQPWIEIDSVLMVKNLENDSRNIQQGDFFLAYPGTHSDGRQFIRQAIERGATAIVYDEQNFSIPIEILKAVECYPLANLADKLATIASRFYRFPSEKLNIVGVTGTNGKTTIAYLLAQAYDLLGQSAAYIGTIGQGKPSALTASTNTTPDALSLQRLLNGYGNEGIKNVALEVSSHALDQKRVDAIVFEQAIFTNLTLDHLDYHGSMQEYAAAKARLFGTKKLKWAIINLDDPYAQQMIEAANLDCKIITYGLDERCTVRALRWENSLLGTSMDIISPWGEYSITFRGIGLFNLYNALAIFCSLVCSNTPPLKAVDVLGKVNSAPGRMQIVHQNPTIIIDYAHTPDALENVLKTVSTLKKGKLIAVFGCGGNRDNSKRPIMGKIAEGYADKIIVTSDNPRFEDPKTIIEQIAMGIANKKNTLVIGDRKQAITEAISGANPDDIIVIAGKGHENYQIIGNETLSFDDSEIAKEIAQRVIKK